MSDELFSDIERWLRQSGEIPPPDPPAEKEEPVEYRVYPGEYPILYFETKRGDVGYCDNPQIHIDKAKELELDTTRTVFLMRLQDGNAKSGAIYCVAELTDPGDGAIWEIWEIGSRMAQALIKRSEELEHRQVVCPNCHENSLDIQGGPGIALCLACGWQLNRPEEPS